MLSTFSTKTEAKRPSNRLTEPEALLITTCSGEKFMGFDKDGAVQLSHIIIDYHLLWSYSLSLEQEIKSLKKELILSEKNANSWKTMALNNKSKSDFYSELYNKRNDQILKMEKKNKYKWVPWTLAGIEAIILSIFIIIH